MKPLSRTKLDARTKGINAAFRRARAAGTKLYFVRNGKLVAETP